MKSDSITTWQQFLHRQFYFTIDQAFSNGARVVVLAFDNYDFVPSAKAPTQRKRCSHHASIRFDGKQDLPPIPPDDWGSALRNRAFKTKVMSMVMLNVLHEFSKKLTTDGPKTLVLDWQVQPEIIGRPIDLPATVGSADQKRGECDIKAFAWMNLGIPLLILSTDGDFLPMGMLQIEQKMRNEEAVPSIYLHRMKTRVDTKKRTAGGVLKREYEFVNVNALCSYIQQHVLCVDDTLSRARVFSFVVASCGCDFAMSLPNIGPIKLWQVLRINTPRRSCHRLNNVMRYGGRCVSSFASRLVACVRRYLQKVPAGRPSLPPP